jgi:hypothetical protein
VIQRLLNRRSEGVGHIKPGEPYMGHTYVQVGVPAGCRVKFDRELMAYRIVRRAA